MKKFIFLFAILASFSLLLTQCDSEDNIVSENALEGGLLEVNTTALNYVVGDGASYGFNLFVYQNANQPISSVKISKYFQSVAVPWSDPSDPSHETADSIPVKKSNTVLQETINITQSGQHTIYVTPLNYAALIENLTIDGNALPASDGELRIGDAFYFIVEAVLSDGRSVTQGYEVGMKVSTRFAGTYKFISGEYWRINVLTDVGSYWDPEYIVESVDAITYKFIGWCAWPDNELYFQIDAEGNITYPLTWAGVDQTLNDLPLLTCADNATDMTHVCGDSNYVIKDDVAGKDRLVMSAGYAGSGGSREFFQIMEKKVE